MTASLLIRPASLNDVDGIVAFNAAMALETENRRLDAARLRQGVLTLLATPAHGFYLLAERPDGDSRLLVGQLMITFEWSDWRNGVFWWIQSVYVKPSHRQQGVFRSMYHHVMVKAQTEAQVCGIRLYVEQENRQAQAVYHRLGFTPSAYTMLEQDFVLSNRPPHHT